MPSSKLSRAEESPDAGESAEDEAVLRCLEVDDLPAKRLMSHLTSRQGS